MVVPVTIVAPAVSVLVPPPVVFVPAAFACFPQLMASMVGLPTVLAMMLDRFVQFMVRLGNAALTTIVIVGRSARRGRECQQAKQGGQ